MILRPTERRGWGRKGGIASALGVGMAAAALGMSEPASAADPLTGNGSGMDTHLFRPSMDSKGLFATNGTEILGDRDISFGLILDYGDILLRTQQAGQQSNQLINASFQGTFQFNYGIKNWVVVGLDMPIVLMTGDAATNGAGDAVVGGWGTGQL